MKEVTIHVTEGKMDYSINDVGTNDYPYGTDKVSSLSHTLHKNKAQMD